MTFKELHDLLVEYGEVKTTLKSPFLGAAPSEIPHNRIEMKMFLTGKRSKLEARKKEIEETEL